MLDVHGGPWARDTWGFGPEAQWLANRGYLCIQVNFRGSTGYGKAFVNAGDREWGAKMQDDLSDAVALRDRAGLGGPGQGRHLRRLLWRLRVAGRCHVHPGSVLLRGRHRRPVESDHADRDDPAVLGAADRAVPPPGRRSGEGQGLPLVPVAAVAPRTGSRIPLLIAQGANDPRVKQAESEQIVAALETAGIDHDYMLFPDEGHGFAKPANRLKFYAAAEKFLAKHLGGQAQD